MCVLASRALLLYSLFVFFFQAEDGIRDIGVTGVQTCALPISFFVQAFYIPSGSMENTLRIGDRVLVSKLTPGPFDLERGDIVVLGDPGSWLAEDRKSVV